MKKLFIITITLLCFLSTSAQESSWYVGPRVGISLSNMIGNSQPAVRIGAKTLYKTGFTGGLFSEFRYRNIGIEIDLLYSAQGTLLSEHSREAYSDYASASMMTVPAKDYTSNYLIIPLKVKYYIPRTGGLNIFAGVQWDLLLDDRILPLVWTVWTTGNHIKNGMSLSGGVGYHFKFGVELTANYNYGLQNLNRDFPNLYIRNSVFQFTARYDLLRFGKKIK